jgi:peptidoglycan/LPS O-acetylase OafA/YrhL
VFERHVGWFVAAAVAIMAVHAWYPLPALQPFALATLVVFAGLFWHAGNFARYGDFSYGVYILHFPIVQLLVHSGWFRNDPWQLLAATIVLVGVGAVGLWHLVEKRFLLRGSHYLRPGAAGAPAVQDSSVRPARV